MSSRRAVTRVASRLRSPRSAGSTRSSTADVSQQLIRADECAPRPWRNGGGWTRELLVWPSAERCDVRIAVADIDDDGPFSSYPGVERWIVVISGVGIALSFGDAERELLLGDEPMRFDGATAPDCRLLDGPTRDLNLMVERGQGVMRRVQQGKSWNEGSTFRGLFTTDTGTWTAGQQRLVVPAMTLLWSDESVASDWKFDLHDDSAAHAWWLGFSADSGSS